MALIRDFINIVEQKLTEESDDDEIEKFIRHLFKQFATKQKKWSVYVPAESDPSPGRWQNHKFDANRFNESGLEKAMVDLDWTKQEGLDWPEDHGEEYNINYYIEKPSDNPGCYIMGVIYFSPNDPEYGYIEFSLC